MKSGIVIITSFIILVFPCGNMAQTDSLPVANPEDSLYLELVIQALYKPDSVDFTPLRYAYAQSSFYTPSIGDLDTVTAMQTAFSEGRYTEAIRIAEKIISLHIVNARAHMICSMSYEKLGKMDKRAYYYLLSYGLIQSILGSGDGKTPETAYKVIAVPEEYVILDVLGLELKEQSLIDHEGSAYDRLDVIDYDTDEKTTLYFNVDIPVGLYDKQKQ